MRGSVAQKATVMRLVAKRTQTTAMMYAAVSFSVLRVLFSVLRGLALRRRNRMSNGRATSWIWPRPIAVTRTRGAKRKSVKKRRNA